MVADEAVSWRLQYTTLVLQKQVRQPASQHLVKGRDMVTVCLAYRNEPATTRYLKY